MNLTVKTGLFNIRAYTLQMTDQGPKARLLSWPLPEDQALKGPLSVVIGNFDGIHKGHQQLLRASIKWAQAHSGVSWVLSFDPHPAEVFGKADFARLFDRQDQIEAATAQGAAGVLLQDFKPEFYGLSAQKFLDDFLGQYLRPDHLVVGFNFAFGHKRQGDVALLRSWAASHRVSLEVVAEHSVADKVVSSSDLREALAAGNLEQVKKGLGRPYYLRGEVISGQRRGRTIDFPTANLRPTVNFVPKLGVYVSRTSFYREGQLHSVRSVTNIGKNPTVTETQNIKIETHLLDFNENLYGLSIKVELLAYLRGEMKFSGIDALKAQIGKDVQAAKSWSEELP